VSHALITGGAGFIGSHLVDRLLTERWKVTVVDNFEPSCPRSLKENNIAGHRARGWYRLVEADLRDWRASEACLDGSYDVIVHLAPSGGTQNLLECARLWGVQQFVYASSGCVYGANQRVPWREDDTVLLPLSTHAVSKISGEMLGHVYSHLHGIRFLALRLFDVYGPRQRPDAGIHKFAGAMLAAKPVEMFGDGATSRDYTYVGDVVAGIRAAMEYSDLPYEVVNLASGRSLSQGEVIGALQSALGVTALLEPKPYCPGDAPRTWANITKAQRLLGYQPHTPFEEGLAQFAEWLTGGASFSLLALNGALDSAGVPAQVLSRL
jgi:UDP-glucuronate 4-epimerase